MNPPPSGCKRGRKVKTSLTLSDELIQAIEQYGEAYENRSAFIEAAVWAFIRQIRRSRQNARDIEIIDQNAERLNAEALDVLDYLQPTYNRQSDARRRTPRPRG